MIPAGRLWFATFFLSLGCSSLRPAVRTYAPMAVTRVVLFQNGLGYFERRGSTASDVELVARRDHLDDLLKSLTVVDRSGGRVASVRVVGARGEHVTLRLGLAGPAQHDLSISYMTEVSGWRPSYRVVMGERGTVRLQGFAVIDNHTGEAWRGVSLGLSTATPLSFRYALHAERVAQRPHFNSDGRLQQEPVTPAQQLAQTQDDGNNALQIDPSGVMNNVQAAYNIAQRALPQDSNRAGRMVGEVQAPRPTEPASANATGGALEDAWASAPPREDSAGVTMDAPSHLDLDVDESAMIPFVDQATPGEAVLLFKPSSDRAPSATRPYRAVMFHNPLHAPLLTGPVTVYENNAFIGDGVTATVPADAYAFVAHALDVNVHAHRETASLDDEVRVTAAHAGVLTLQLQSVLRTTVTLDSPSDWGTRAFVHVAAVEGYRPRALPDGSIEAPGGYYLPVASGQHHAAVTLDLLRARTDEVHIETDPTHPRIPALLAYLSHVQNAAETVAELHRIHERSIVLRDQRATLEEDLVAQQRALAERREALGALRDVASNAGLRARIGQSVAEGVAAVDAITRRVVSNNAEALTLREQWYALTRALVA